MLSVPEDVPGRESGSCPGRLAILEAFSGEGTPEERSTIDSHVSACPVCGKIWRDLEQDREILRKVLPEEVVWQRIKGAVASGPAGPALATWSGWRRWAIAGAVVGIAGLVCFLVFYGSGGGGRSRNDLETPPELRAKGTLGLRLWVERAGRIVPVVNSRFCAGDRIQAEIESPTDGIVHVFVLSGTHPIRATPEGRVVSVKALAPLKLPFSLVLDDSGETERLLVLLAAEEDPGSVAGALEQFLRSGQSPPDLAQGWSGLQIAGYRAASWLIERSCPP
jgi:hypothetical protein